MLQRAHGASARIERSVIAHAVADFIHTHERARIELLQTRQAAIEPRAERPFRFAFDGRQKAAEELALGCDRHVREVGRRRRGGRGKVLHPGQDGGGRDALTVRRPYVLHALPQQKWAR